MSLGRAGENLKAAVAAYLEEEAATADALAVAENLVAALARLKEQNSITTAKARVGFSVRGGMEQGTPALAAHVQIRDILDNQLAAAQAILAALKRAQPLVHQSHSVAQALLNATES